MDNKLSIGDEVKIHSGEYEGQYGVVVYIGTNGSVEVYVGGVYWYLWDFQLEKVKDADEITQEVKEEQSESKGEETMNQNSNDNPIKDSGERREFSSGAVRDMAYGKGDMLSMPWVALLRLSKHYENGARKYQRWNYAKGIPTSSFIDSAMRHLAKYCAGEDSEDHLSACVFNCLGAMLMEAEHPEMCDIPSRVGKNTFPYFETKNASNDGEIK